MCFRSHDTFCTIYHDIAIMSLVVRAFWYQITVINEVFRGSKWNLAIWMQCTTQYNFWIRNSKHKRFLGNAALVFVSSKNAEVNSGNSKIVSHGMSVCFFILLGVAIENLQQSICMWVPFGRRKWRSQKKSSGNGWSNTVTITGIQSERV